MRVTDLVYGVCYSRRKTWCSEHHDFVLYQKCIDEDCLNLPLTVRRLFPTGSSASSWVWMSWCRAVHVRRLVLKSLKQRVYMVPLTCFIHPSLHFRNSRPEDRSTCGMPPLALFSVGRHCLAELQLALLECMQSSNTAHLFGSNEALAMLYWILSFL